MVTKAPHSNQYLQTTNHPEEVSTLPPRPKNHFVATTTLPPRQYGKYVTPHIVLNTIISSTDPTDIPDVTPAPQLREHLVKPVVEKPQVFGPQNFHEKISHKQEKYSKPTPKTPYRYKVVSSLPKRNPSSKPAHRRHRPHHRHGHDRGHHHHPGPLSQEELELKFEGNLIKTLPLKKKYVHHVKHPVTPKPVFLPHRAHTPITPVSLNLPSPEKKEFKIAQHQPLFRPTTAFPKREEKDVSEKKYKHPYGPTPKPHSLARKPFTHALPPPLPPPPPPPPPATPIPTAVPILDQIGIEDVANVQHQGPIIKRVVLPTRVKSGNLFVPGEEIKPTIKSESVEGDSIEELRSSGFVQDIPQFVKEGPFFEEVPTFDNPVVFNSAELIQPPNNFPNQQANNIPDFVQEGPFFEEIPSFDEPPRFDTMRPGFVDDIPNFVVQNQPFLGDPRTVQVSQDISAELVINPDSLPIPESGFPESQPALVQELIHADSPEARHELNYDVMTFESAEFSGFADDINNVNNDEDDMDYAGSSADEVKVAKPDQKTKQLMSEPNVETLRRRMENLELLKLPRRS